MKTILNLKTLLIAIFVCNLQAMDLFAQDPELFEHTWYFVEGEKDGEIFHPLLLLNGELTFHTNLISIYHPYCEDAIDEGVIFDENDPYFSLYEHEDGIILIGVCGEPDETEFMSKHYGIYRGEGQYYNPFTYTIQAIDNHHQFTIENGAGDWAVYSSMSVSTLIS